MSGPYYADDQVSLYHGHDLDILRQLPDQSVDCVVTSPPYYGLRDYGVDGQRGLEDSPAEYVSGMVEVFAEVRRVLADDGTLWLNIGDSYSGSWGAQGKTAENAGLHGKVLDARRYKYEASGTGSIRVGMPPAKNLLGIPWRLAFALQDDGWILRNDIIWHKPNAMPESVTDRLSTRYEHVFLLTKSRRYWFDLDTVREPHTHPTDVDRARAGIKASLASKAVGKGAHGNTSGGNLNGRNPGDVWSIPTAPFAAAHFAVMPLALSERCILAGCKPGGVVLDPYSGSGTTGLAATKHGRRYVGIDLNADYLDLSLRTRLQQAALIPDFESITSKGA